mgnify:CR=1 FL=1
MNKHVIGLSAVLVLQILIGAGLYLNKHNAPQSGQSQTLLSLDMAQIDKITIQQEGSAATLLKKGDNWLLPKLEQLPADKAKLHGLVGKLETLQTGWPIATTNSSHERFEVSKNKHQRHLQLYQGDQLKAELFIGTSPDFRKVHVRKAGQEAVYSAKLNTFDLPAEDDQWLDKNLLAAQNISGIQGPDYSLEKQQDKWQLSADLQGELNQESVQKLLSAINNLRITELSDETTAEDPKPITTNLRIKQGNKELSYTFRKQGKNFSLSRSDIPQYFGLTAFDYSNIAEVRLEKLLLKPEAEISPSGQLQN